MTNKNRVLAAALMAALFMPSAWSQTPQTIVAKTYAQVTPAICLITYSADLTNPQSGQVEKRDSRALGLIVSRDGLVMAHGHMQRENATPFNIRVAVGQGEEEREYPATLLKKPDDINVCFMRLESAAPLDLPHVTFERHVKLAIGDPVAIIGLLGETLDFARTVTHRNIGAILEKPRTTYCLDDNVPFGCVGGPAINANGRVIGVIGFDLTAEEGGELYVRSGHPLLYQSDLFARYIDAPPTEHDATKTASDAWLGVFMQPLTDDLAEYWELPKNGGIVVGAVVSGSPGEKAGIQRGDVIVSFNGMPVRARLNREVLGFTKLVRETGVGATVPIKLLRDKQPIEVRVTLIERPKPAREAEEFEDKIFGLTVRELTTDIRILLNLTDDVKGVIVRRVKSGSSAELAGLRPGVLIMTFGGIPVENLAKFEEAVKTIAAQKPGEAALFCRVGPRTGFFRLQPRWDAAPAETPAAPEK